MILYLHGFLSSPASAKARALRAALASAGRGDEYLCPLLPASPRAAAEIAFAAAQLEDPELLCLVGSSLGGYYATWVAEQLGCRAVLLNPAVRPYELLAPSVGWQRDLATGLPVEIHAEYLDELRALETADIRIPERYLVFAATGDEVIDYREMIAKYANCHTRVIQGSDHALTDFDQVLPELLRFCGVLAPVA